MTEQQQLAAVRQAVAVETVTGGRLGWLECLIDDYEERSRALEDYHHEAHGEPWDKDPDATHEMILEVRALLAGLQQAFPRPATE